jgi:hypothetical protein
MAKKSSVGTVNPTHYRRFTSFSSDVDLTAQSAPVPQQEAERLECDNQTAAAIDIVIRGPDAVNVTFSVPANSIRVIRGPVSAIESTGTGAMTQVHAFWWKDGRVA